MSLNFANRRRTLAAAVAFGTSAALLLGACGTPGQAGGAGEATPGGTAAATCEPVAGDKLVVLKDDLGLQTVDNLVPAVNAAAAEAHPGLVALLDTVSGALTTDLLVELNRAVVVDRRTSAEVATEFVAAHNLAATDATIGAGQRITVGAADFAESATLGALFVEVLNSAGFDASVMTIGNREAYLPALIAGDQIQIVPEYVGTLAEFLNRRINGADATPVASSDLDATMSALTSLGEQTGLVFGTPSAAANQNAFAVTQAFAEAHNLTTLSDLAAACQGLVLGAGPECVDRPFCQPGLERVYGLTFSAFRSLDAGGPLTMAALRAGEITIGLVFSSDGSLG